MGHRRPYPSAPNPRTSYGYRTTGRRGAAVPPLLLDDGRRRLTEFLMPAAVILAGVLIVVAFGFIISRAVNDDDNQAIPPVQPPALGDVPLNPPADQFPIPLPSASDSRSPSPAPTPSKSRTTQPVPTTTKPRPPDQGSVKVARNDVPSRVDLTAEGSRDWVHWGEQSTFSLERRADGDFQILEGSPTAPRFRHGFSRQLFSWRDGSPVNDSDGTPTGIRTCGKGNGFTISAPAGTSTRTLRLYVGALAGRGKLTAKLSAGSASATSTFEERSNNLDTAVFVITYRAPKNGKINLSWTTEEAFSQDCGGVALEAATLR